MSLQPVPARLNEKKVSCPSASAPVQSTSSGICIKQEYFSDQLLMTRTISTESESAPNEHNIMQSIKVEVKEEHYHDQDCPECLVKRELAFDEDGEQMDTERDVKIGLSHSTSECSRSTTIGTSSSSVPPQPPITDSTTIRANIKVEIEDSSTVQPIVQLCECVKKEEEDGGEYVMECDCEDCETCRVKMEMKEELDESGETELGGNIGETVQGFIRIKQEEENGDVEGVRPYKIQRMDLMVENVPVGVQSSTVHSPNVISTNVECIDDQMSTSSTTPTTIQDHTQPSQPVTFPLPTSIVTPNLLNQVHPDQNYETEMDDNLNDGEQGDEEDDETIEQREDLTDADDERQVQVSSEEFVKRIEPADELGNKFECDYRGCVRRMKLKRYLINHIRTHTGERPFKCSVAGCDRAFVQKGHLDEHLKAHTGIRPFDCTWPGCEARFLKKSHFTAHLRTHTGDRPFKCETCNATFAQSATLATHRRIHTGSRPFVCTWPDCGQAFISSSHLHSHSRVHSNERQFVCDVTGCTNVYKSKDALRRHQKSKHN